MFIMSIATMSTETSHVTLKKLPKDGNSLTEPVRLDIWGEIEKVLNSSVFLKWKKWLIIDEHKGSERLTEIRLKRLWAETLNINKLWLVGDSIENQKIDFIIISPRFNNDRSISDEYSDFLTYLSEVHPEIPVFACTGGAMSEEVEALKSFWLSDILIKPVDKKDFNASLMNHFGTDIQTELNDTLSKREN